MGWDDDDDPAGHPENPFENVHPPELKGDGLDELRLNNYADRLCLALGIGHSPQAAAVIELNAWLTKLIEDTKG